MKVLNSDFTVQRDDIVTQFCPYGTLYSFTEAEFTSCEEFWSLTDVVLMVTQIFRCIAFFHNEKHAGYGFLSPGNFWITSGLFPLLSCITTPLEAVDLSNASLVYWMAPEAIESICEMKSVGYNNQLCDVYSAGLIALEFLTTACNTRQPKTALKNHALHIDEFDASRCDRISNLSLPQVPGSDRLKREFLGLMKSILCTCCARDPCKRPQAGEVVIKLDAAIAKWYADGLLHARKWRKYKRTVMRAILTRSVKQQDEMSLMKALHSDLLFPLSNAMLYFEVTRQPSPTGVLGRLIHRLTEEETRLKRLSATTRISHVPALTLIQRIMTIYPRYTELSCFCQQVHSLLM